MQSNQRYGLGSGGFCICPKCGAKIPHRRDFPCQQERCPDCGAKLAREGSYHHNPIIEKKRKKSSESG